MPRDGRVGPAVAHERAQTSSASGGPMYASATHNRGSPVSSTCEECSAAARIFARFLRRNRPCASILGAFRPCKRFVRLVRMSRTAEVPSGRCLLGLVKMDGGHALERGPPRIALRLSHRRIDSRLGAVPVRRHGGRARPAADGPVVHERSGFQIAQANPAVDDARVRRDGDQRHPAVLRHPGAVVPEHLLPREAACCSCWRASTRGCFIRDGIQSWDRDPVPPRCGAVRGVRVAGALDDASSSAAA